MISPLQPTALTATSTPPQPAAMPPREQEHPHSVQVDTLGMSEVWDAGFTGKGIGIAVIDTGVAPHPDVKDRLVAFKDFVNHSDAGESADPSFAYDDGGHGTAVSTCAAGDGQVSNGRNMGTAPGASIIGLKGVEGRGYAWASNVVNSIQWAIENKERYNIRVLSMSLGAPSFQKAKYDLVAQAVEKAYDAGLVPVIAAGNSGPTLETIGSPGISDKALTVGAYDDKNTADLGDDTVAFFSSRGPTTRDRTVKPDIVSPGVNMVSTLSPKSMIDKENIPRYGDHYILLSGTSMATPVAAGIVACMLQANPGLTPAQTIDILKNTTLQVADTSPIVQGSGLINPVEAVKTALSMRNQPDVEAAAPKQA